MLRDLVEKHGTKKWSFISTLFENKGSKQCRRRWQNRLSMDAKKRAGRRGRHLAQGKEFTLPAPCEDEARASTYLHPPRASSTRLTPTRHTQTTTQSHKKEIAGRRSPGSSRPGRTTPEEQVLCLRKKKLRDGGTKRSSNGQPKESTLSRRAPAGFSGRAAPVSSPPGGLSIDIPGQAAAEDHQGKTFAINLPKDGLTREDLCLIDEVNLLNTPLQVSSGADRLIGRPRRGITFEIDTPFSYFVFLNRLPCRTP